MPYIGDYLMVFGLNVKPEHGYYVEVAALDGDLKLVEIADKTPDGGLPLNRNYLWSAGRAVDPTHMPTRMEWRDRKKNPIPDVDNGLVLNVSDRAKALIEQFEPEIHQFLAVEYFDTHGRRLERRWFFIANRRIDSLDHRMTTMILEDGVCWTPASDVLRRAPDQIPSGFDVNAPSKMVFNRAQIGDAHIWCDKHLLNGGPFISDAFAKARKSTGMTGLRLSENGVETV